MIDDVIGSVFGSKAKESFKKAQTPSKEKIVRKIKDNLKKASLLHHGYKRHITFANHHYVELNNGWVVQMDRNDGRNLHIYEDKTNDC